MIKNAHPQTTNKIIDIESTSQERMIINNITSTTTTEEIFSSEDQTIDYLTIQGINTRFGLSGTNFDIFIIKELLDNAIDFIEENAKQFRDLGQNPFVNVVVSEVNENLVKISVKNSNAGKDNDVFTEDKINNIFNLKEYYSSKKYRHKINRGELGDAFKAILGIPYAIILNDERENYYTDWENYPLQINISNKKLIEIRIDSIEKIRTRELVDIKKKIKNIENIEKTSIEEDYNFTEIIVYIPKISVDYYKIKRILKNYAIINTHIDFNFKIPSNQNGIYIYNYPATQESKYNWKNNLSIYSYSLQDFRDLIISIAKKDPTRLVFDVLKWSFREGSSLPKDKELQTLTFGDLKSDINKIQDIYNKLKSQLQSIQNYRRSRSADLQFPFEITKESRKNALRKRLSEVYQIEEDSFSYTMINKYYKNPDNGVEFPYRLEIVIAKSPFFEEKKLTLIESLNCSPSLHSTSLFHANQYIFNWINTGKSSFKSQDIVLVLEDCGYSVQNNKKHTKDNNLIIINLISPRVDYNSHSKSNIKLEPFADIAQDVYKFCKSSSKNNCKKVSIKHELTELLKKRLDDVTRNPKLKITRRWTQSTAFYLLRPIQNAKGVQNVDKKRSYITGLIKKVCNSKELGYKKRHELGIIAAERAQLYYEGRAFGISFDRLEELMKKGTDLLVIEKEGIADILMEFANKRGIAILNSRGFLTEYAEELAELAEREPCNIAVLTDLDSAGLIISTKIPNGHRIGIDFRIINSLELDYRNIEEDVTNNKDDEKKNKHLENLNKFEYKIPKPYRDDDWIKLIDYLNTSKRIEIDGVLAAVREPEIFWNYIFGELEIVFPERDYNRSIDVNNIQALPKPVEDLIEKINDLFTELQSNERKTIIQELANKKGFVDDLELEKQKIKERLLTLATGEDIEKLKETLYELIKKL